MARPVKWRRVEFIPNVRHFIPVDVPQSEVGENILQIEELEALRLKDLEGLEQEACAERMGISRQTFQRILNSAREKVADSLVNGKAIRIGGGYFTRNICRVYCRQCMAQWDESYENFSKIKEGVYTCPHCGSNDVVCHVPPGQGMGFCRSHCWRHGQRR
ncbi:MAG: uncharacterized protein PWR01_426 [Clostridiales bacterium]|nr:uncharacterized protein [Clostridiales bacterium]